MKGNRVFDIETHEMKKGDFMPYNKSGGGGQGIIYCCPVCGEVSAGTDRHRYNASTQSVTPSIVHECGYHGYLKNGNFINA